MIEPSLSHRAAGFAVIGMVTATGAFAQGGDDAASAVPIAVPETATGTTVGYVNDSDETCPYAGSTSPDVYYRYDARVTQEISIDLCEAGYDTKTYVYDSKLELVIRDFDLLPACNDDACSSSGGGGFRSFLDCVPVQAGAAYFIVVDGWAGAAGPYQLITGVTDPGDCVSKFCLVACIGSPEGERCDFGNTAPDDLFNGGCNCTDPAGCFSPIACEEVVCGQGYFDGAFRDTDWYALDMSGFEFGVTFDVDGLAEFASVYGRYDNGNPTQPPDCSSLPAFAEFVVTDECNTPIQFTTTRLTGTVAIFFVAADFSQTLDCNDPDPVPPIVGADYALSVTCNPTPPCPWDFDRNGQVGWSDLLRVLSNWGACP